MTYLIIEHFYPDRIKDLYDAFDRKGRLLPEGLTFLNSWIDEEVKTCYQIMESPRLDLLYEWTELWKDYATFEIIPVINSEEARKRVFS